MKPGAFGKYAVDYELRVDYDRFATAQEIGLKLQECCYINPEPWSAADYMHGPIAALRPGDPVIVSGQPGRF